MSIDTAELRRRFLELIKIDEEFRLAVAGAIGMDEIIKRLEKHDKKFTEILERLDRHEKELVRLRKDIVALREDLNKGFERYDREIAKLREDMNRGFDLLRRHIDALGARWGVLAEEAFREGLRGIIEEELGFKVERWTAYDEEGYVFGHPSVIEVDVALVDEKVMLIEISSHVRASDVATFRRRAEVYAKKTGRRPDRLIIVTPFVDKRALTAAKELGIEIYTKL